MYMMLTWAGGGYYTAIHDGGRPVIGFLGSVWEAGFVCFCFLFGVLSTFIKIFGWLYFKLITIQWNLTHLKINNHTVACCFLVSNFSPVSLGYLYHSYWGFLLWCWKDSSPTSFSVKWTQAFHCFLLSAGFPVDTDMHVHAQLGLYLGLKAYLSHFITPT